MKPTSLLPIDVGFDLKTTGHAVQIDPGTRAVTYEDSNGDVQTVQGSTVRIQGSLLDAGYVLAELR
jgi:hypothetical protein